MVVATENGWSKLQKTNSSGIWIQILKASFGERQAKKVLGYWLRRTFLAFCVSTKITLYDIRSQEHAWLLSFLSVEKPSMFLVSEVIKCHFGAYTESQESSSIPVAKKVLGLCLAKRRL